MRARLTTLTSRRVQQFSATLYVLNHGTAHEVSSGISLVCVFISRENGSVFCKETRGLETKFEDKLVPGVGAPRNVEGLGGAHPDVRLVKGRFYHVWSQCNEHEKNPERCVPFLPTCHRVSTGPRLQSRADHTSPLRRGGNAANQRRVLHACAYSIGGVFLSASPMHRSNEKSY
jgi:hypothetical protein